MLGLTALLGACYNYTTPLADRPVPATTVEVTLNDRGRAGMEEHLGPEILTALGTVTSVSDSGFVLHMARTETFGHTVQRWAGEDVVFRSDYVRQLRERRFSAGKTVLLVGSATASAVVFLATKPLLGRLFGDGGGPTGGGGTGTPGN